MRGPIATFRTFDRPSQVLMVNQFTINLGFYMLMPYLAGYLAGPVGLAGWAIGLVLGIRNFSQQGMFLIGGTLADRLGFKPLIVAGCLLRTIGFVLLATVESLPALLIASVATGFAGALFNPAVRAYLAADAGDRRIEAFAIFNIFYQGGILIGPLVGVALMAFDFQVTSAVAAGVFGVLTVAQILALPRDRRDRRATAEPRPSVLADWRTVASNRRFVLFSCAMIGSYVLSFQVYLALPLHAASITSSEQASTYLVAAVFVVTGVIAVAGQLRITAWFRSRFGPTRSLSLGMALMTVAFVPLLAVPTATLTGQVAAIAALLLAAAGLAIATATVFPFEMDTVVSLSGNRLVATHYGLYNTVVGVGILAGNLGTGALMSLGDRLGFPALIWLVLIIVGSGAALALRALHRAGALSVPDPAAREADVAAAAGMHRR
ncbi:MFS transporter [Tsukamurella tyrosinosolvens]|uniref:Multidrug resistance protein MdtH n=5 Tax=Tsukamurella TaxID=2060 RepID=A0A3P8KF65_TSUPA|nr:MFS transporter [Tsukamurella tyrosinosolvens]NMD55956.1 MFS transporter [Tsukamurella columbiensis]RDH13076.1 MFS transporter [Tsukamurella pulmonis]TWS20897.1 MFS transporter [Tsukamurella asaccharolytica]TWS23907.1 MFS transporter [Tsukamurella sputi]VDR38538.1 Multidrug resistance protein MdtH [Tsukamurella paurometabola]